MENTGTKELIKSILIMAGIPLAFSVACSSISKITKDRKISSLQGQNYRENDRGYIDDDHDVSRLKEQIFVLRSKIEEVQELEREIEDRFFRFVDLKDQEYALMEVQNSLIVEKERAEFLERELSSMEVENKKFDEMVIEYLKALEELESSRFENALLRRRVKKLLKKTKECSRLIRKQMSKIEEGDGDKLRNEMELKLKDSMIKVLEREIEETRAIIDKYHDEKNEILNKLEIAENTVLSKAEDERILMENYNRVAKDLEQLQKDRAAELKELIYLRWCHACLRHEIARRNELEQERKAENEKNDELELGFTGNAAREECIRHDSDNDSVMHHDEPFFGPSQQHSKRRWLVKKFKKWVDGSEKPHEAKCCGSLSNVDATKERHMATRRSFSSA